jgi:hypothetical protein
MKFLLSAALAGIFALSAQAQVVVVDIVTQQNEFLSGEAMTIGVRIANQSGRELHLGRDNQWLKIDVRSLDERRVGVMKEIPIIGAFTVESPMRGMKLFDIEPYFEMNRPGRYFITATVFIREGRWQQEVKSAPKAVNIVTGLTVWDKQFGVIDNARPQGAPEVRKYALQRANMVNSKMKMYLRLSSVDGFKVYRVVPIDYMTSFSKHEAKTDKYNNLHVLLQTPRAIARDWNYSVFGDDGRLILRRTYNADHSRPRLRPDKDGLVQVVGGMRRSSRSDLPKIEKTSKSPVKQKQPAAGTNKPPVPFPAGFPALETSTKSGK